MKIISSLFEQISGIGTFPIISMFFFLLFFAGAFIYAIRLDKKLSEQMGRMPLDGDTDLINDTQK
jgi:hypothetical protein